jgi:hypothetical protein
LNLVAQWGASRVLLIGFDVHDRNGVHWYGRNNGFRMSNPDRDNFRRWLPAFETAGVQLAARGIEVVNASPTSDIRCFPKASVEETLKRWEVW